MSDAPPARWHEGLVPAVVGIALGSLVAVSPLGGRLELWLNDQLATVAAPPLDTSQTLVIAIDDETLDEVRSVGGTWPFQRDLWAHVLDYLQASGAAAIVIDVVFAEPRIGDHQLSAALARIPHATLAAVAGDGPARAADSVRGPIEGLGWSVAAGLPGQTWTSATLPVAELAVGSRVGVANVSPDLDGVVRRITLFHRVGEARLPALPLAALVGSATDVSWEAAGPGGTIRIGDRRFRVGAGGDVELWFPAPVPAMPAVSFGRVARAALTSRSDDELQSMVRGRRVFIGATALLLDDAVQTPADRLAGVVFVAAAEALLRQGQTLRPATWAWDGILLLLAVLMALTTARWGRQAPGWFLLALPVVALIIGIAAVALLLLVHQRTSLLLPLVAAAGVTVSVGMQEVLRLRRDQQRIEAERLATERAAEQKSRFLSHVAHELRTPVAAILGFSRLLSQEVTASGESRAHAQTIARNASHMLQLINNLLADVRLSIGRVRSEPHPASIRQLLRDIVATLDGLPRAAGVELEVDVEAATPDRLMIDDLRVRQILLNLLGNSAKFTRTGRISLAVDWHEDTLIVHVEDTGPGIPPEAQGRIFDEFDTGSSAGERAGGSGLGLSVSRRLARLMGGDLRVASSPGVGSRFTLEIPAAVVPAAVPGDGAHRAPIEETAPLVLVCDDADDIRQLFTLVLEQAGARVIDACDGAPAVDLALSARPAVVLLDIDMPAMNGIDAFLRMRAEGYDGPVVAVTGAGDDRTAALLLSQGFAEVVHKPMPVSRLLDVVASHVPGWQRPGMSDGADRARPD